MMKQNKFLVARPAAYIRTMFANTKNGKLVMEPEDETAYDYLLDWDEETAEVLAVRCENLLTDLEMLAGEHDRWMASTQGMPEDLLEVWNTYILPYPDHGMDSDVLLDIHLKATFGDPLTLEEQEMLARERRWMEENALTRLPYKRTNPAALIQQAKRYERLLSMKAPQIVLRYEAEGLAEELVLYHCLVQ